MENNKLLCSLGVGFCSAVLSAGVFLHVGVAPRGIVYAIFVFGLALLMFRSFPLSDKRTAILSLIFSAALSVAVTLGDKFDAQTMAYSSFVWMDSVVWLLWTIVLYFPVFQLLRFLCEPKWDPQTRSRGPRLFLWSALALLIAWLPTFLAWFPGIVTGDSLGTINQSLGITPYNNHHPILYTLFQQLWIRLGLLSGSYTAAIALCSVVQMLLMAFILSYCIHWLDGKGAPYVVRLLILAYFALNPVIAIYSISMWKDILFGAFMLLLILYLYDTVEQQGANLTRPGGLIHLLLLCLLVAFGRNNGAYLVLVLLPVLAVVYHRYWKRIVPVALAGILLIVVVQGPVYNLAGVRKSSFAESVGIPLQQLARTVTDGGTLTAQQEEFLSQLLPLEEIRQSYNPTLSDPIKFHKQFNAEYLETHKGEFFKVWLGAMPANFTSYLKAYFTQTLGYWHIGTTNWLIGREIEANDYGLELTDIIERFTGHSGQKLYNGYFTVWTQLPVAEYLFSISLAVWVVFLLAFVCIRRRDYNYMLPLLPLILLWGTMMVATPTFCEFRYMFSFHLSLPVLAVLAFRRRNKSASQKPEQVTQALAE